MYKSRVQLRIDVPLLGFKEIESNENFSESEVFMNKRPLNVLIRFDEVESAGTEISYRCVRCCVCADCKNGERIECISIQEEVEQAIIDLSVTVDIRRGKTSAKLPFLCDPNRHVARLIYDLQVKKLGTNLDDKKDMSENKLQDLGFVDFL